MTGSASCGPGDPVPGSARVRCSVRPAVRGTAGPGPVLAARRKNETGQTRRPAAAAAVAVAVLLSAGPAASLAAWTVPQATGATSAADSGGVQPGLELFIRQPTRGCFRPPPPTAAAARTRPVHWCWPSGPEDEITATLMRADGSTLDGLNAGYAARAVDGTIGDETLPPTTKRPPRSRRRRGYHRRHRSGSARGTCAGWAWALWCCRPRTRRLNCSLTGWTPCRD